MEDKRNGWHTAWDGTRKHYRDGEIHREDGPAVIFPDGTQVWYLNGLCHRKGGPAVIHPDGTQGWYRNRKRHREDGPAIIFPDGSQCWLLNGKAVSMEAVLDTPEKMEAYLLEESLRRL